MLLGLLAVACNGGGGNDASKDRVETTTTTATKEQDEAFARRILLTVADLPPGFAEDPEDKDAAPDDPAEEDAFDKCIGPQLGPEADAVDKALRAEVDSPDFEKQGANQVLFVSSSSSVFDTEATAGKAMGLVGGEPFKSCANQALRQDLQRDAAKENSGVTVTRATIGSLAFPQQGEETVALRLDVQVRMGRQSFTVPIDVVFFRKDRAVVTLVFGGLGTPFPPGDEQAIASKVVARL